MKYHCKLNNKEKNARAIERSKIMWKQIFEYEKQDNEVVQVVCKSKRKNRIERNKDMKTIDTKQKEDNKSLETNIGSETGIVKTNIINAYMVDTDTAENDKVETKIVETNMVETNVIYTNIVETDRVETDIIETDIVETDVSDSKVEQRGQLKGIDEIEVKLDKEKLNMNRFLSIDNINNIELSKPNGMSEGLNVIKCVDDKDK